MAASIVPEIGARLTSVAMFGVLAALVSYIAYRRRFFQLPFALTNSLTYIRLPIVGFIGYLFVSLFSTPAILLLLFYFFADLKDYFLRLPLLMIAVGQTFTLCITTVFLLLFAFLQKKVVIKEIIFGPEKPAFRSQLSHCGMGMVAWLVSFPIAGCLYELTNLLTHFLFGVFAAEQRVVILLQRLAQSPGLLAIMLIAILIGAPIIEEFFFRGILQNYLKCKMRFTWALILSSLIFSLLHLSPGDGWSNLPTASALFTFALYLGFIYERQRSLLAPIALHMTFNSINVMRILLTAV
ncbi:MAG: CPBP family intramembrane glutamic endopeptidase [Chlamydiota bacterium]